LSDSQQCKISFTGGLARVTMFTEIVQVSFAV